MSPINSSANSTLRCGKESKERRNRERLLQGPGSDFSLVNPETDMELDYYDYNVINASAVPGSYLGMDPAFLVWIPPIGSEDSEINLEEHHYEEIPARKTDSPEGSSLSKRLGLGTTCQLHDEIIMEYKARLGEGILPIHRILEESRVRVSEESGQSQEEGTNNKQQVKKSRKIRLSRLNRNQDYCRSNHGGHSNKNVVREKKQSLSSGSSTDGQESEERSLSKTEDTISNSSSSLSRKSKKNVENKLNSDVSGLNRTNLGSQGTKREVDVIPMAEFSRNRQDSPVRVHCKAKNSENKKKFMELQSPDYGVDMDMKEDETMMKETLYSNFIGGGEEELKFADDDDEYVDNKVEINC